MPPCGDLRPTTPALGAAAAAAPFDAVLLDLTVTGGMGGLEAAAKLKQLDPAVKLIVSSGYSDAPVPER